MTPTPTIPVPARRATPIQHPGLRPDEQPAPTIRVPVVSPSGTSAAPVTPPPTDARRISRSVLAAVDSEEQEPADHFPRVGERFLGFQLVGELGEGAFARVFLANQESLAGRPVALKVTLKRTREAERLARLQHTNIVPVYSVHDAPSVQVICMPYLGKRTIADLIRDYRADHSSRLLGSRKISNTRAARSTTAERRSRSSAHSHSTPASHGRPAPVRVPTDGTAPPLIGDPLTVVKVLAQLAAGLAHAHGRGILHLDLKPANVLLPDAGEPMLLDFNLSFDTTAPDRDLVGGTIPYMATEQLLDLKTRGRGQVDARTDLYALGVMAFEMLTGTVPFPASSRKLADIDALIAAREKGPPSVRELNPDVTPAVESIVRKLLAPDPKDRYQTAEELRTDAERHLNDLPLRFAAEPSVRERFGKWKRRNPGVFGRLIAACLLGLVVGLGGVVHMRAESHARAAAAARVKSTHTALDQVRLDLVLPGDPAARARGIARAEEVLAAYALPDDPDWTKRPEVRLLSEQDRAALTGDLGELMLLLAQVKWQGAAGRPGADPKDIAAEAMKLNRAAGECFADGARPAMLDRQAADLAAALGEEAPAAAPRDANAAPTARDLFLEAAGAVARSDYAAALKTLEATLKEQPGHAAAQFCLAYCRYQLGQYERALEGFDVAERMLPPDPRPAFQRGVIYGMKRYHKEAEEQYSRAINLDPEHAAAHRNRGLARLRIGQQLKNPDGKPSEDGKLKLREAEADLTQALELGASPYPIYSYREQARRLLGEVAGADADKRLLAKLDPSEEADFISRGKAREEARDFEGALADYRAAARVNPRSLTALHNQICILADVLSRNEEALAVANRLADLYPNYAVGRAGRAVLLARLGRRADAHAEAEQARKLCKDPEVTYQAACVYALTAKDNPDDRVMAVALLERALKDGYRNVTGIKTDPDLDSLHQDERFIEMLRAAETLFQ